MVRLVKLLIPYLQLAFIGWVVWTANVPEWQTVASLLLLAWVALGIAFTRLALALLAREFAKLGSAKLLENALKHHVAITKPRHRR